MASMVRTYDRENLSSEEAYRRMTVMKERYLPIINAEYREVCDVLQQYENIFAERGGMNPYLQPHFQSLRTMKGKMERIIHFLSMPTTSPSDHIIPDRYFPVFVRVLNELDRFLETILVSKSRPVSLRRKRVWAYIN